MRGEGMEVWGEGRFSSDFAMEMAGVRMGFGLDCHNIWWYFSVAILDIVVMPPPLLVLD